MRGSSHLKMISLIYFQGEKSCLLVDEFTKVLANIYIKTYHSYWCDVIISILVIFISYILRTFIMLSQVVESGG